ncbi:hypothetical protein NO1_1452 [Candidatus Termititenax aidoneus]|uniref:DUF4116 domain-containing protein n=1 Tax=Termititenax aidoneus TaxID=2218524 RepID=A0A388TCM0_TERA1|nr:hypothetical protein NO1_1452 [Candidatus Termititenax aidoneus]
MQTKQIAEAKYQIQKISAKKGTWVKKENKVREILEKYPNNKDIVFAAVEWFPNLYLLASDNIRNDVDFNLVLVKNNKNILRYITDSVRNNPVFTKELKRRQYHDFMINDTRRAARQQPQPRTTNLSDLRSDNRREIWLMNEGFSLLSDDDN